MIELSILAFIFSKTSFMLWRWYDVWYCPFFYRTNALISTSLIDHGWSFSSSHMICSSCILTFLVMIVWTCVGEIKRNTWPFLHKICRPLLCHGFLPFRLMMCLFNFLLDLIWSYYKMVFWLSLYFHEQVKKEVRENVPCLIVGINSFMLSMWCIHASFPWRWNIINVHKFNLDSKRSIHVITIQTQCCDYIYVLQKNILDIKNQHGH